MAVKPTPLSTRFWKKVDMPSDPYDCWNWIAGLNGNGYGVIGVAGRGTGNILAHRYSFFVHDGILQDNEEVCHTCDNPRCVNPFHLYAGTRSDNTKQAWRHGRSKVPVRWRPGTFHYPSNAI